MGAIHSIVIFQKKQTKTNTMHWTDMDHSFCEEHLLGLPEYYNSISSLFIIFFGIHGLMNRTNETFIDVIYASLAIVGFGSTGYHWYGNIGWALFDEIPMILTVFYGIIYTDNVYYLIYKNKYIKDNSTIDLVSQPDVMPKYNQRLSNEDIYNKKKNLLFYLFIMCFFTISNIMSDYRLIFPNIFTCVVVYLFYKINCILQLSDVFIKSQIISKTHNSFITIGLSGAIWACTEIMCQHITSYVFLLGHPMWHFFIGHGFYNLIQVVFFIKLHDEKYKIKYNSFYMLQIQMNVDNNNIPLVL